MPDENGRVSTRDFIQAQINGLREYQDTKFAALQAAVKQQQADAKEKTDDHETRIRSLEKRITWSNVVQGTGTLFAYVLGVLGLKQ